MFTWVLIVFLIGAPAPTIIEFDSLALCTAARDDLREFSQRAGAGAVIDGLLPCIQTEGRQYKK